MPSGDQGAREVPPVVVAVGLFVAGVVVGLVLGLLVG